MKLERGDDALFPLSSFILLFYHILNVCESGLICFVLDLFPVLLFEFFMNIHILVSCLG
jgi:hypothetical protein